MPLGAVTVLSDQEDGGEQPPQPARTRKRSHGESDVEPLVAQLPGKLSKAKLEDLSRLREKLGRLLQSKCGCARSSKSKIPKESCFLKFAPLVEDVLKLRRHLHSLHKLDADRKAFGKSCRTTAHQKYCIYNVISCT